MAETVFVDVRYFDQSAHSLPLMRIAIEEAREWVREGLARWSRGCKFLRLKHKRAEPYRAAMSLKPGQKVMEDFVVGKKYAIEIVNRWAFGVAA